MIGEDLMKIDLYTKAVFTVIAWRLNAAYWKDVK